jgi:outer membrane protein
MKKILLVTAASLALIASPAFAENAIGVVNIAKIMKDSKAATSVRDQIQAKQKAFQAELDSKEKELLAEDQSLVKEKSSADKAAFDKKVKTFREKAAAAQRQVQEKKAQLDKAFSSSLEEIQQSVVGVVKEVAEEKKMTLAISSAQVLYNDQALDITDEVLKRLDAKLPKVAVKF